MTDILPVPPELLYLIEKRKADERRRAERRTVDLGPLGSIESAEDLDDLTLEERRSGEERRGDERRES